MKLTWKRQDWSGAYFAKTDTHKFVVDKVGATWRLRVWVLPQIGQATTAQYIHYSDDHRTMAIAKSAAQTFADQATK